MSADAALTITMLGALDKPKGQRAIVTIGELARRLTTHREQRSGDVGDLYAPATFRGNYRNNANAEQTTAIVADFDGITPDQWRQVQAGLDTRGLGYIWHTTYQSTPDLLRIRVWLFIATPIGIDRHLEVWHRANAALWLGLNDASTKDRQRCYRTPICPPGALRGAGYHAGAPLDWEALPPAPRFAPAAGPEAIPEPIPNGQRRRHFLSLIGSLRARHVPEDVILACLRVVNEQHCATPAPDEHIVKIVRSTAVWDDQDDQHDDQDEAGCTSAACQNEKAQLRDRLSRFWRVKRNATLPRTAADTGLKMVYEAESAQRLVNGAPVIDTAGWAPLNLGYPSRDECVERAEAKLRGEDPGPAPRHGWAEDLGCSPKTVREQLVRLQDWGFCELRTEPTRIAGKEVDAVTGFRLTASATAILDRLETFDPTIEGDYTRPGRPAGLICRECGAETRVQLDARAICLGCGTILATTVVTLAPDAPVLRTLFPREVARAEQATATSLAEIISASSNRTPLAETFSARGDLADPVFDFAREIFGAGAPQAEGP